MIENKQNLYYVLGAGVIILLLVIFSGGKNENEVVSTEEETVVTTENSSGTKNSVSSEGNTGTAQTSIASDGAYIISYTNSGFGPKTLQILVGKSVRFVNNSDKAMRIFADDQQFNSEINQSKSIGKGEVYNFTFTDKGVFKYHNENNPNDGGTILVY